MQRVPSNKQKALYGDVISKYEEGQKLLREIESMIEVELASMPNALSESNIARVKKSKRKRLGLIKDLSKKTRQVVDDMEYDPETNTWIGNEDALMIFSPQPVLITNRGRPDRQKVVGNMVWDPTERTWRGNEQEVKKFSAPRVGRITQLNASNFLQKEIGGMVYDPVSRRWLGNEREVDVFAEIDKLEDDGFTVGNEFFIPPSLTKSFIECASRHKATLSGWFHEEALDRKSHLYSIREMSILRIVRDVKQRTAIIDLNEDDADVFPERDTPSSHGGGAAAARTQANESIGTRAEMEEESYDDFDFNGSMKLKLKLPHESHGRDDNDEDWGADDDDVPQSPVTSPAVASTAAVPVKESNVRTILVGSANKEPESGAAAASGGGGDDDDDNWDDVFDPVDTDEKLNKMPSATTAAAAAAAAGGGGGGGAVDDTTFKKPFQLLDHSSKRSSVIDLSTRGLVTKLETGNSRANRLSLSLTKSAIAEALKAINSNNNSSNNSNSSNNNNNNEDEEEGFDLPPGPVNALSLKKSVDEGSSYFGDEEEAHVSAASQINLSRAEYEGEFDNIEEDEEEEDWGDVDIPSNLHVLPLQPPPAPIIKGVEKWDDDKELQMNGGELVWKGRTKVEEPENDDDDDALVGLEIPVDFDPYKKRGETIA